MTSHQLVALEESVIRDAPSLTIGTEEIDRALERFREAFTVFEPRSHQNENEKELLCQE